MITFAEGQEGRPLRTVGEIASSYDKQAQSSYVTKLRNPFFERYGRAVGRTLAGLSPSPLSLLDVGTGDGYTLDYALREYAVPAVVGVDVSKERLKIAASILGDRVTLREMDLFDLRFEEDSFYMVMTSHAIEPNGGREREAVRELLRVARRYVLMLEPDYCAAPPEGQERMRRLGYITRLWDAMAEEADDGELSWWPFEEIGNPLNPTTAFLIRKGGTA